MEPIHTISEKRSEPIFALEIDPVRFSNNWGDQPVPYRDVQEPQTHWMYWIGDKDAKNESVEISVQDSSGTTVTTLTDEGSFGFNTFDWNLKLNDDPAYLGKGNYTITYKIDGETDATIFKISDGRSFNSAGQRVYGSPDEIQYEEHEEY